MSYSDFNTNFELREPGWRLKGGKNLVSVSSSSSLTNSSSLGWKPMRKRGAPRTPAPPFFKSPKAWFKHELWSWRFYVWIYAAIAGIVAGLHLVALIAVAAAHPFDDDGRAKIIEGSCSQVIKTNRYAHWFMSVLSTGYLSASAYVMYCLTGPTREEVTKAHSQGRWLDIGVLSLKNLTAVSKKRAFFFVLLGLSSPLIQFFYNSLLFITYSANSYTAFVAQESFTRAGDISFQLSQNATTAGILEAHYHDLAESLHNRAIKGDLERLNNSDCIDEYTVPLLSKYRNLVLVTADVSRNANVFGVYDAFVPTGEALFSTEQFSWICDDRPGEESDECLYRVDSILGNPKNWTVLGDAVVSYCLAEKTEEHCKLQVSLSMSLTMLFTIVFKVAVMFAVAITVNDTPLMTTGDAIESFMKDPDPFTQGMCMASKRMIEANPHSWPRTPIFVSLRKYRWAHGIKTRIAFFCLCMVISLCLNAALFTTVKDSISINNFLTIGIGQINRNFFIGFHLKDSLYFVRAIFIANVGHAIFGVLYIVYNNVFYAMTFSWEWARFAHHRKGIRISEAPRGCQRTVYFFLMPLRLAIPIMAFSAAIHTLISQTLFLVDVETYGIDSSLGYDRNVRTPDYDFATTSFSPLGNALLLVAGALMITYLLCCASTELKSTMPVTSTCSAAIAAACHPDEDEPDDFYLHKLSWGVTSIKDGIGHCTFSSKDVEMPDEWTPYA